jgi:GDPmannose 4,6-dehydratase
MKKALITGVTGQDGSYLAENLLEKGYEVYGLVRRTSSYNMQNIENIKNKINIVYGDLEVENHMCGFINDIKPDEVYNLAAQSDVRLSFDIPQYTSIATGQGALNVYEAVRKFSPYSKIYQASTSEMFGSQPAPQNEETKMLPNNPYGVSKLFAHNMARVYRDSYNMFISCGILWNHESPRRGLNFVTRKICNNVAKIYKGQIENFSMGNMSAKRDWGYAPEYVECMWKMLQQDKAEDFAIGTGEVHTVEEFMIEAFKCVGIEDWSKYVIIDKKLFRPSETSYLMSDPSKAREKLGWEAKVRFNELVKIMMEHELK